MNVRISSVIGMAATWRARELEPAPSGTSFRIEREGAAFAEVHVPLLGDYNVRNALAAAAVAVEVGLDPGKIVDGLASFEGVRRRLEVRGTVRGITVYDDFAHHPTAAAETLAALRAAYPGRRVWAIFEPRSATACRKLTEPALIDALAGADEVILPPVYRTTLPEDTRLAPERVVAALRARGVRARHLPTVDEIVRAVAEGAEAGDQVVVMSNGAFGDIHGKLVRALGT